MHEYDHHSRAGLQALAEACLAEAGRRRRPELAGDFFCQCHHESRNGKRARYSPRRVAWQAAGHVLQSLKGQCDRLPPHADNRSLDRISRTDRGESWYRQLEFAFDLYRSIGQILTLHRINHLVRNRSVKRHQTPFLRPAMPPTNPERGPLRLRIEQRIVRGRAA